MLIIWIFFVILGNCLKSPQSVTCSETLRPTNDLIVPRGRGLVLGQENEVSSGVANLLQFALHLAARVGLAGPLGRVLLKARPLEVEVKFGEMPCRQLTRYTPHVTRYQLRAASYMLHATRYECTLHAARYTPQASRREMLGVASHELRLQRELLLPLFIG